MEPSADTEGLHQPCTHTGKCWPSLLPPLAALRVSPQLVLPALSLRLPPPPPLLAAPLLVVLVLVLFPLAALPPVLPPAVPLFPPVLLPSVVALAPLLLPRSPLSP